MDLRKHKQRPPPAPAGSREILLDITKNFINPSHLLFQKEEQAGTKEGAEEEEEEGGEGAADGAAEAAAKTELKAMTEVCASSSHMPCRNGSSNDAEAPASPPCRRRSSIKDADELCHGRPALSFAMDSPVFASRGEALRFHSANNMNRIAVPSDSHEVFLEAQQMVRSERRNQKPGPGPKLGLNQKVIPGPKASSNQRVIPDPKASSNQKVISEPKVGLNQKVIPEPKLGLDQKVIPEPKVLLSEPKLGLNQKAIPEAKVAIPEAKVGLDQKVIPEPKVLISEPKSGLNQKAISEAKVAIPESKLGSNQKVIPEPKVVIPEPKVGLNQKAISEPRLGFNQKVIPEPRALISEPKVVGSNQKAIADPKSGCEPKLILPLHESRRTVSDPKAPSSLHSETHEAESNNEEEEEEEEGSDREVVGSEAFHEQLKGERPQILPAMSGDAVLGHETVASVPESGESNHHRGGARSLMKLRQNEEEDVELSIVAFVFDALRRSGLSCKGSPDDIKMDIGRPTDVRHIAHVTFDRFNGFLGLPAEFQMQIPRIAPSASVSAFGVSAQSMQCSYDRRGNSVPTILLLLQERLYEKKGLRAEGIFRINAENSQEEHVRSQLNHGVVPHGVDVHCLAGMIKAWFRELPRGVLDSLSPDQVMQCNSEEQAVTLMKTLPPMERGLLDWGVNLMADVVHEEPFNKMNAHNIAMVFAPNMTQVSDPLIALMHAVQVMNLLKMLILRTLRDRGGGDRVAQGSDAAAATATSSFHRRRDSIDGCEPSHESKERSARRILPKYEYEYFVNRQGSASNAS